MASQIKVDQITDKLGTGAPSFPQGIDAADLTGNVDAALLTGTLPALDGSALTGVGGTSYATTTYTSSGGSTYSGYDLYYGVNKGQGDLLSNAPAAAGVAWTQDLPANSAGWLTVTIDYSKFHMHRVGGYYASIAQLVMYRPATADYKVIRGTPYRQTLNSSASLADPTGTIVSPPIAFDYHPSGTQLILTYGSSYNGGASLIGGTSLDAGFASVEYLQLG